MTIEMTSVWQLDCHTESHTRVIQLSYRMGDCHTETNDCHTGLGNCHTEPWRLSYRDNRLSYKSNLNWLKEKQQTVESSVLNISFLHQISRTNSRREKLLFRASNSLRPWFLVLKVKSKPLEIFVLFLCNYLADHNP